MSQAQIFQIFYDEKSKSQLDDGFKGLDNTSAQVDGWFEFSPIFNFLESNSLTDDVWYGFLSPKFTSKTGCDAAYVYDFLNRIPKNSEVAIFSPGWDQLSYFLNPWEQGELWHPTITQITQEFLVATERNVDLKNVVADLTTSVFSNYVIAKKRFWMAWWAIAKEFKQFVAERSEYDTQLISYGSLRNQVPIKTFIQERLATYLLVTGDYVSVASRRTHKQRVMRRLFSQGEADRKLFLLCDQFKRMYRSTQNKAFLDSFYMVRQQIALTPPY